MRPDRIARNTRELAAALLAAGSLLACGVEEPPPEPVRPVLSVVVADVDAVTGRRFPGTAKAAQELELSFEVAGQLVERPVDVGTEVEEGQLVARLDPRDFEAELKAAEAELKRDQANLERAAGMLAQEVISQVEYDRIEAKRDIAEAAAQLKRKALEDSVLLAPFTGRIADIYVENFQTVRQKQNVARLLDTSTIEMVIQIPESIITSIRYVRDLQVRFDAVPDVAFPARIREVSNEASRTTRTYPVTLSMELPEGVLVLPGMAGEATGRAELPDDMRKEGIQVPAGAVFADDASQAEQSYVWVVDEGSSSVTRRPVTPLRFGGSGVFVQGVEPGERIVTAGVHSLREGQAVRVRD